jgi:hypothetical protein
MRRSFYTPFTVACLACLFAACGKLPQIKDGAILTTNANLQGNKLTLRFTRGPDFGQVKQIGFFKLLLMPQIAVWVEDTLGNHLQTLYVTRKFAKQDWGPVPHNNNSCFRTSSLPFWLNKYDRAGNTAPTTSHPLPDAITSATPQGCFDLNTVLVTAFPVIVRVEINSSFDYNKVFNSRRKSSKINGQPALVYEGRLNGYSPLYPVVAMKVAGHSGETGEDSLLYKEVSGLTTATGIFSCINILQWPPASDPNDSTIRTGATKRAQ